MKLNYFRDTIEYNFQAHKFILSIESTVLEDLFRSASGDYLEIPEFKFETVKAAVNYCYAQDMTDFLEVTQNALELLTFADKYDFKTLKVGFFKILHNPDII